MVHVIPKVVGLTMMFQMFSMFSMLQYMVHFQENSLNDVSFSDVQGSQRIAPHDAALVYVKRSAGCPAEPRLSQGVVYRVPIVYCAQSITELSVSSTHVQVVHKTRTWFTKAYIIWCDRRFIEPAMHSYVPFGLRVYGGVGFIFHPHLPAHPDLCRISAFY